MQLMNEIPDTFWSLFRSVNRDIYIEALLCINEEYEYNNYFLTKEVCIQILSDMNAKKRFELQREENDTDFDMLETPSSRIFYIFGHNFTSAFISILSFILSLLFYHISYEGKKQIKST